MPVYRGQDRCSECKTPLPDEGPCPRCGSTKRTVPLTVHTTVTLEATVDRKLIICWQEVDRLLAKAEYAAALLVAAVNVEFILWENLQRFTPTSGLTAADDRVSSAWGKIQKNQFTKVSLSSLLKVTEYMTQSDAFVLSPTRDPLVREIDEVRNRIAHERGYFPELTKLKDTDWPEPRIRQVLEDAKEFCHGNAP